MVDVEPPSKTFFMKIFHFFLSFSWSIFTLILHVTSCFSFLFLVSPYYGLCGLGLKGGILSQTMHSHRSYDIPQLCTDPSYLYIVIWFTPVFLLSLKIDYDTLVSDPVTEGPACRLSPSQDSHAILGSWSLQAALSLRIELTKQGQADWV